MTGHPGGAFPEEGTAASGRADPQYPGDAPMGPEEPGVPGSALLEAVRVMDRLRSPGGCPWDRAQTHATLLRYLVEECYELVQAVEDGDADAMREELGDVLLQVLFHSRIAAETRCEQGGFDIDEVAEGLVGKLVRRHPYVFGTPDQREELTPETQQVRWDELKKSEKERPSALDGVALGQPALALAGKLGARAAKYDVHVPLPDGDSVAEQIFRLAYAAGARGEDPEGALRAVARAHASAMAAAEPALPES
ncbi:MAG TPA: MazG family protein [Nakamurella sp.]|nr:MazG family protein [Nakamurella sp.]